MVIGVAKDRAHERQRLERRFGGPLGESKVRKRNQESSRDEEEDERFSRNHDFKNIVHQ